MEENKVQNPKTEVTCSKEMNDCDYLNTILELEKNMSNNLSTALNEASNEDLYNEIFDMFTQVKESARELFQLSFKKGWYSLEKANTNKVQTKHQELTQKLKEIQE